MQNFFGFNKFRVGLLALLLLSVILAACGDTPTATAVPPTATAVPPTAIPAPAPRPSVGNPIIATITAAGAGGSFQSGPTPIPTTAIPATPTLVVTPPVGLPVYSNLKLLDLGSLGKQIGDSLSQAGPTSRSMIYSLSDSYDKLATFYNTEMIKAGYAKVAEQPLPDISGLTGNVLVYSKGTGTSASAVTLTIIGPLDPVLITAFSQAAPSAANLKPGDSIVIVVTGLTAANLLELQKSLGSPAPTPTK